MSETLRDLVVSLSLNSDNFTRNIKSINKQIQEAESAFRLASAGVENFETTSAAASSPFRAPAGRLPEKRFRPVSAASLLSANR